ncbi:hypothetical protein CIW54_03815 [Paraburkholderia sp. T12-10]|nr:hypothetical protein CIW54_03815 [Paraburkholderia sp. T12-10]
MIARTVVALAVAGLTGMSAITGLAQERERGHESARGPSAAPMQAPGAGGPSFQAPNQGRAEGRQRQPGGGAERRGGEGPPPRGAGPAIGGGAVQAPQAPGFGLRPSQQFPAPAQGQREAPRPNYRPEYGHRPMAPAPGQIQRQPNGPGAGQQFGHRPGAEPRAPLNQPPRAYGRVPAPYRGDIHRFVDLDARVWRGGRWRHSHHDGRFGWWWVVGGLWYLYPQPVYPYPDPFAPGEVVYEYGGAGDYWYYCESAGQYYPYVTECPEGWQAVIPEDE